MIRRFNSRTILFLLSLWGVVVGGGMARLYRYENTPSHDAQAPPHWPDQTRLARAERGATLLLFLHPHCPCSSATIGELERLAARSGAGLAMQVVFLHPDGTPPEWHQSALWARVGAIPGVHAVDDPGGLLARQFGVATSGQTLFYDSSGMLRFSGGITRARGHAGDNPGSDIVQSLTDCRTSSGDSEPLRWAVFGCPLFEETDRSATPRAK